MRLFYKILVLLVFSGSVNAEVFDYRFRSLNVNEGLSHTDAPAIVQDSKGLIWIGTYSGLNRYDGYTLRTYKNTSDPINNVFNNRIQSMAVDKNDLLWISTELGLKIFDIKTESYLPDIDSVSYRNFFKTNNVTDVFCDSYGNIWFLCFNQLFLIQESSKRYSLISSYEFLPHSILPDNIIFLSIAQDSADNILLGTNKGLLHLKTKENDLPIFLKYYHSGSNSDFSAGDYVSCININKKNEIWLGSYNSFYFLKFNYEKESYPILEKIKIIESSNLKSSNKNGAYQIGTIYSIVEDDEGNVWYGTWNGLFMLKKEDALLNYSWHVFDYNYFNSLSVDVLHIKRLLLDKNGCLFIGTWGSGISILDLYQKRFHTLNEQIGVKGKSLSDRFVRAICEGENNDLWIGTESGGLNNYNINTGVFKYYNKDVLTSNNIRCVGYDTEGNLWIGTNIGLNMLDIKTGKITKFFKDPNNPNSLCDNAIYSLCVDKFGQLWVGSWNNGVSIITKDARGKYNFKNFYKKENDSDLGLSSNRTSFIYADSIYPEVFVSSNKGVDKFLLNNNGDVVNIVSYQVKDTVGSFTSSYIWPILRESENVFWFGTLGGGLNKVLLGQDNGSIGQYNANAYRFEAKDYMDDIESMLFDDNKNLWIAGKGIIKFNSTTEEYTKFDYRDGLQSNSFKIGAAFKGRNGILYFGGINGLNYFHPDSIKVNSKPSGIVFTDLYINNERVSRLLENGRIITKSSIAYSPILNLKYDENNFTIFFTSTHYASPSKNKYRYILQGRDNDWINVSSEIHNASFANLPYGKYVLNVQGTNNDGLWSDTIASIQIHISPPWWRSIIAWFVYILIGLSIAGAIFMYWLRWYNVKNQLQIAQIDEKQREEMHQMKLRFFTNISHEFRTPLSLIIAPVEELLNDKTSITNRKNLYELIYKNAKRLNLLINELLSFRKAETGADKLMLNYINLNEYLEDILQQFRDLARRRLIDFETNVTENEIFAWIDFEKMDKMVFNILSNAFKYTDPGGCVSIKLYKANELKNDNTNKNSIIVGEVFEDSEYAIIEVRDTGIGISIDSLSMIFERFYQVSENPESKHLGSGIGLALVKALTLTHKSCIEVMSEKGQGTCILLKIPLADRIFANEQKAESQIKSPSIDVFESPEMLDLDNIHFDNSEGAIEKLYSDKTILIVEDNRDVRELLASKLMADFRILEADNGQTAYTMACDAMPDLIISDVMMPKMNGFELCSKLKNSKETSHIPIIMLTAKSSYENQIEGANCGADVFIAKPFNLEHIVAAVSNIFDNRRRLIEKYSNDVLFEVYELGKSDNDKAFLDELVAIINKQLDSVDFNIELLCREIGLGRTALYKKVKVITGVSLGDFIRSIRLKTAAKYLLSENVTISEIVYRVGFSSKSYFTKAFKEQFGKTPSEFVEEYRNK